MAVAAIAGAAWLPFLTKPLSPDEGGFLLVASQWSPGGSLYGHYWVDRPPLLITLFDLATHLGGGVALRLLGVAAVVASVLLTAELAHRATGRRQLLPAVVAAAFLTTPLFGTTMVNGELLAAPFVLAASVCAVSSWSGSTRAPLWAFGAGVAGAAAPMIKQNVVDGLVVAAALVLTGLARGQVRRALSTGLTTAAGSGVVIVACLALAEARGTEPTMLWDAVVTFRAQAASVIQRASVDTTPQRFVELIGALLLSGAPLLAVALLVRIRRPRPSSAPASDLASAAVATLAWELVAVLAGGSYWLHYLLGLVPGLVLLAVAAGQRDRRPSRLTVAGLGLALVSTAVATVVAVVVQPTYSSDQAVATYLRAHGTAHDTVVVGFGHPNIVWDSGMTSPYEHLWSLPVRVRDPHLRDLTHILRSSDAPTWVVVNGDSLATWGVETDRAQAVLDRRYRPQRTIGAYEVWRLASRS